MEIWKDINDYESVYQINQNGDVKSLKRKSSGTFTSIDKIIRKDLNKKGYYTYTLCKNNKSKRKLLHRLLAETFIANPNNYPCVNHIDGNPLNNNLNNLEWCTYSYNTIHGYEKNGRLNPNRKLKESEVIEIKERLKNPYWGIVRDLSIEYNVSNWIISLIKNFKSYKRN
jgi:hypothetical protein